MSTATSHHLLAAVVFGAACLGAQSPTPSADSLIPGTSLHRCATPTNLVAPPTLGPGDCSYNNTNPLAAYAPTDVVTIPVVVHVIQNTSGTGNLSDQRVQSQITVLNEDFRAMAGTPGAGGFDTGIQFVLATTDPNGNPTTGITRHTNNTWWTDSGSYWNSIAWPTDRYLNIYTNNIGGGGTLGYVPDLPQGGSVLNTNADRVVILYSTFGRPGTLPPYDTGRTTTHEVGHYLGLFHTFDNGCGTASCYTTGDRICDTNSEANPRFGCPGSATSCGTADPFHNFMDYTDDTCMTNFTSEQARRMRCTLMNYRPLLGGTAAQAVSFGAGCYTRQESIVETFGGNGFDLAGTAAVPNVVRFVPNAVGYDVLHGAAAWFTPGSPDLGLSGDGLLTINLPFAFSYFGGSTNVVRMAANGFVWLDGVSADPGTIAVGSLLASGAARFAPLWMNLDPTLGGSCHYDIDPAGDAVYFTWSDVPYTTGGAGNTAQLVLRSDGGAEFRWQAVPNQPSLCAVGFTKGFTAAPSNTDLSASLPTQVGPAAVPLSWTALDTPILGTTVTLQLGNIVDPLASIGLTVVGWSQQPSALDLAFLGAPGCPLLVTPDVLQFYLLSATTAQWSLPLPASQALVGVELFTQGAELTNGVNALGLLTANGVELVIGSL
ncbi:MAG: zinc metalloprotease [Planctomycetes bacterium]|nr:zinc metalloprotease [Planctomycetota bacterium]